MRTLDLIVLAAFLVYIVWDGIRHGRKSKDAEGYLLAGRRMRWWAMGLSVMATQASAITLISTTGYGFDQGMHFLHFYLAIPFAMVILCATVVPWYHRSRVFTAYEYLERRFDRPTRLLVSLVFLVSRALAVGTVLYAPSIVLERGMGLPKWASILSMGVLSTVYTAIGGNTAVIITDAKQMLVMVAGIVACIVVALHGLPSGVGFVDALKLAGAVNRLDTFHVTTSVKQVLAEKYNVFSGLIGGLFLFLGYFGADQEQVQRYLAGSTVNQSRKSLLVSAFAKVPMQFVILLLGVLLYVDYTFAPAPTFFRAPELERELASRPAAETAPLRQELAALDTRYAAATQEREAAARAFLVASQRNVGDGRTDGGPPSNDVRTATNELRRTDAAISAARTDGAALMVRAGLAREGENKDSDYVFTHFLITAVPVGIAGLVLAAIFAAAISSLVSPINSLATSSVVDWYVPLRRTPPTQHELVRASRIATLVWGAFATVAAFFVGGMPIIEQVNRIGSMVYGSLFGIFILAWLVPRARGAIGWMSFAGGLASVAAVHFLVNGAALASKQPAPIEFLWYNPIGFFGVLLVGFVASRFVR